MRRPGRVRPVRGGRAFVRGIRALAGAGLILSTVAVARLAGQAPSAEPADGPVIGMVIDGPWERNDEMLPLFRGEILDLTAASLGASVPLDKVRVADWTAAGVRAAVDALLADPEVDIVIGLGVLASNDLALRDSLPKPSLAPVIIDPDLQGLPDADGRSGIENLNYLAIPLAFANDMRSFQEIGDFRRIVVLMSAHIMQAIPTLADGIPEAAVELGLEATVVPVEDADAALSALPADAEAVYLAPLHSWREGELDRLVEGLIARRLPSFARMDETEVARGFLATLTPREFFDRLARRLALNVQSVLLGEAPGEMRTDFAVPEQLTINMATARAIGVYPPWKVITEAVLLNQQAVEVVRTLDLVGAIEEAVGVNLDLAARGASVEAGAQDVARSRSNLLPQLGVSATGLAIDEDRAEASFGSQAQRQLSGSLSFSQLLFSDRAWTDLSVQRSIQRTRELDRDALALDVSRDAAVVYLNVLRAKTFERVQQENLDLTRNNLANAEVRVRIGAANPAERLRWESQVAIDRQAVIDASARRNVAELEMNRILHRPLEEPFGTAETGLDDERIDVTRLYAYMDDPWSFRVFRAFMASEAIDKSPEIRAIDAALDAQGRLLTAARRSYWLPTVSLQAGLTDVLARGGAGSDGFSIPGADSLFGGLFPTTDDLSWNVAVSASLPLFQGGRRAADTRRASRELDRLRLERAAAADRIEARVRASLHRMGASYAAIDLSRSAADAARENFELVSTAYSEGAVTILDLLDAQNAFLLAELAAASATYDFLIDLVEVQRAAGAFAVFSTEAEREAFLTRLDRYMSENRP